jgi:hypothetical protein
MHLAVMYAPEIIGAKNIKVRRAVDLSNMHRVKRVL